MPPKGIVLPLDDRPTLRLPHVNAGRECLLPFPAAAASLARTTAHCQLPYCRTIWPQYSPRATVRVKKLFTPAARSRSQAASASPRVRYNPKSAEPDPDSEACKAASGVPLAASMRLISAREGCWGKTTRSKSFWIQVVLP